MSLEFKKANARLEAFGAQALLLQDLMVPAICVLLTVPLWLEVL